VQCKERRLGDVNTSALSFEFLVQVGVD
jgi:hypothetical protein